MELPDKNAAYQNGKLRSNKDYELDVGGYCLKKNVKGKMELCLSCSLVLRAYHSKLSVNANSSINGFKSLI